ncbi:hypothetical protein O976_20760 [Mycobacterium avium subsp. paratuberculosis 10-8425]|nr:hypothetical protein O976_20760 [Mycobacterium avium subsp. paratuberculosis 10-8425]
MTLPSSRPMPTSTDRMLGDRPNLCRRPCLAASRRVRQDAAGGHRSVKICGIGVKASLRTRHRPAPTGTVTGMTVVEFTGGAAPRGALPSRSTLPGPGSVRVTAAYAAALLVVYLVLAALGPHARQVAVSRMSTNVHNLGRGQLGTLIGSAFVDDGGELFFWLPGLVCLLALGELLWRGKGLLVTFAVGHIGATMIVAVGLVAAIESGMLPASVARASDVGISYGAMCVLGAITAAMPVRWRGVWAGWWLGTAVVATVGADFTAVGHVVALLLGIGLSFRLRSTASWTPVHLALLCVGATFGYLLLAGAASMAPIGGLAGAFIGVLARARRLGAC